MKNVNRSAIPASLAANSTKWRDELLQWIEANPTATVPNALVRRYAKDDVREALRKMYWDQCCYCEGRIKDVSHDHIEHRQPKSKFRDRVYDWENLHLACPQCNIKKGDKWNETAPILDAVVDRPVEDHLTYETGVTGVLRWPKSQRGKTTVEHAGLNRDGWNGHCRGNGLGTTVEHAGLNRDGWNGLPGTRGQIFLEAFKVIQKLKNNPDAPEAVVVRHELEEKKKMQYGSVIAFALEEAGL